MWRPFPSFLHHPEDHDARLEVPSDEFEKPLIRNTRGKPSHKDVVVNPVEEFFQVTIYYPCIAFCNILLGLRNRLMSASSRSKSVTAGRKRRIKKRREHLQNGLLDEAVKRDGHP